MLRNFLDRFTYGQGMIAGVLHITALVVAVYSAVRFDSGICLQVAFVLGIVIFGGVLEISPKGQYANRSTPNGCSYRETIIAQSSRFAAGWRIVILVSLCIVFVSFIAFTIYFSTVR